MTRTVEVPEGFRAVLVSDQLIAHWEDWTSLDAPHPFHHVEAKVQETGDPLVIDVLTRYVGNVEETKVAA